jgi:AcrR family transcriptional regulator
MPRTEEANQVIREESTTKILDAARRVFARKGSAGTMAEVAAEAGISQGLAYRYFSSKEAIFITLAKQMVRPAEELNVRIQEMPGTAGQRLDHIISKMLTGRKELPEFYQFMYQALNDGKLPDDLREAMYKQGAIVEDIIRRLIVEGQATGEIAKDDPDQLLAAIMACVEGIWKRMAYPNAGGAFPDTRIVLRMLRPDPRQG